MLSSIWKHNEWKQRRPFLSWTEGGRHRTFFFGSTSFFYLQAVF